MDRSLNIRPLLFSFLFAASALLVSFAAASAQSSFYKYVDRNGKVIFTDRLEAIPEEYQQQVRVYKGQSKPETASPAPAENSGNPAEKVKEAGEGQKAGDKEALEKEGKTREERAKRITGLQDQIRAKQQEQRSLRTTWMVYDRIKLKQLNEEIASLEKQILSLRKEPPQD